PVRAQRRRQGAAMTIASFLSPELEDSLATFIAVFVIFVVPVVLIVAFWLVHILPEQIAHKRNHPQFEAIRTLCLLSLVFGGLLLSPGCGPIPSRSSTRSRPATTSCIRTRRTRSGSVCTTGWPDSRRWACPPTT